MLRLDFSYREDFSNDEGDSTNKMLIIIIGRNQRAANNSFLKICLTFWQNDNVRNTTTAQKLAKGQVI